MKKAKILVSLLLISLLAFSTMQLISGNFASASTCAANFLPTYYVAGTDTPNEITLSHSVANYIVSVLNSKYPIYDYRDSACTGNNYKTILSALQNYDNAVIYSKGHRNAKTCDYGNTHYGLIMNDSTTVWDYDIYPRTSSKNVHSFIWHCQTAIMPTGTNPDACGYRGLPIAFTHNLNIPRWGSTGSQVYLGWTDSVPPYPYPQPLGGLPQYEWTINANYNYAQVAALYYYYMGQNYQTSAALIAMANTIYGTSFQNTYL